jgi:hypothetical protein
VSSSSANFGGNAFDSSLGGMLRRPQVFRAIRGLGDGIPIVSRDRGISYGKGGFNPTPGAPPNPFGGLPGPGDLGNIPMPSEEIMGALGLGRGGNSTGHGGNTVGGSGGGHNGGNGPGGGPGSGPGSGPSGGSQNNGGQGTGDPIVLHGPPGTGPGAQYGNSGMQQMGGYFVPGVGWVAPGSDAERRLDGRNTGGGRGNTDRGPGTRGGGPGNNGGGPPGGTGQTGGSYPGGTGGGPAETGPVTGNGGNSGGNPTNNGGGVVNPNPGGGSAPPDTGGYNPDGTIFGVGDRGGQEPIHFNRPGNTRGGGNASYGPGGGFSGFAGAGRGIGGDGTLNSGNGAYGAQRKRPSAYGFAGGGFVPGVTPGAPQPIDTVDAKLAPNEMVMNTGVTSNPTIAAILTLLNILGAGSVDANGPAPGMGHEAMEGGEEGEGCPECGQPGFGFGGWVKDHWKGLALGAAGIAAAPLAASALGAGGAGAAGAGAAGGTAAGTGGFMAAHPGLAAAGKFAAPIAQDYISRKVNPPPTDNSQYMIQPPQPQGYAMGGHVGEDCCGTCGRPKAEGYAMGGFASAPRQGAAPFGSPAATAAPTPFGGGFKPQAGVFGSTPPAAAPPRNDGLSDWKNPWQSGVGQNGDLGGARQAGYFDPRGNQMLINSQREAAQGTADALVRRQMSQADLGGLDPAQRAVAKLQALRDTGRGVQDIMAQTRAGALASQDEFYKKQYEREQSDEAARLAGIRSQSTQAELLRQTGVENRKTKKAKGK